MTGVVVDASVALAWCFADEASDYADEVLLALEGRTVLVPSVWALEITNAVLVALRRKRVKHPEVQRFVELLGGLTIIEHSQPVADSVSNVLPPALGFSKNDRCPVMAMISLWRLSIRECACARRFWLGLHFFWRAVHQRGLSST